MIPIKQSLTYDQAVGAAEHRENHRNSDLQRLEKVLEKLSASHDELSANFQLLQRSNQNQRDFDAFNNHGSNADAGHRPRSIPSNI
jgi:hypothetical protein